MKYPEEYQCFTKSIRDCSLDDDNGKVVVDRSELIVCFDDVKNAYIKNDINASGIPCSVDGLFLDEKSDFIFVEFKSGAVNKKQFIKKVYDSSIILMDKQKKTVKWLREHVRLLLVHGDANPNDESRRNLARLGSQRASHPVRPYLSEPSVGFFLKDYEYLTPEQFISKYCD